MAIVRAGAGWSGEVYLVEVMEYTVDRVEDGAVGVVFSAAVLVHQVVRRRVCEWGATELIQRRARLAHADIIRFPHWGEGGGTVKKQRHDTGHAGITVSTCVPAPPHQFTVHMCSSFT
eukprot:scaffold250_cov110-Isochrysis_galbana.AAC.11